MKIIIPGGSGQVGTMLARAFLRDSHEVVVLSRNARVKGPWRVAPWDPRESKTWSHELNGADVVINLAGRSVDCRYTKANRREIMESRTESAQAVGKAIRECFHPPRVWLQASTATIYSHRYDAANDEFTGALGGSEESAPDTWRFSIEVATAWEKAATDFLPLPHTRLVLLRSAMTMSPDPGGIFATLLRLVRLGLGGTAGDGRQYVSWIHEEDFIRAIYWLIENAAAAGPVNLAAPEPLPNFEFMRALRKAWGTSIGLPAAKWMLEIGALALRTESELILKSRRVIPGVLCRHQFAFKYPEWPAAAGELCQRWRNRHSGNIDLKTN